jgi:hypothetical protein
MDDAPFLTENGVRDLLDLVASDDAPPTSVSIARARAAGRRRRRLVRVYLPGAAPVAAAVAVALIAGLTAHLSGAASATRHHPAGTSEQRLRSVPTEFSALTPYASFGWLPAGYSAAGLANQTTQSNSELDLTASAANRESLNAALFPARDCTITGPVTLNASTASKLGAKRTRYPHSLTCGSPAAPAFRDAREMPLTPAAGDIDGASAYWTVGESLVFEYGQDAWGRLNAVPQLPTAGHVARPARSGMEIGRPSAGIANMMIRVASDMRFGQRSAVSYGFTISGLPSAWQTGRAGSTYAVALLDGRLVNVGWGAGPADDPTALSVSVTPAATPGAINSCNYVAGQSWYVTLDGARVMLRTIDQPYKHWEELCAPDVRGLSVYITLDTNVPSTNDRPLPGGRALGGVVKVFRHLTLLGPDVKDWTTQQPG